MSVKHFLSQRHLLSTFGTKSSLQAFRHLVTTNTGKHSQPSQKLDVENAQPFSKIPGPPVLPLIKLIPSLLPGGQFHSDNFWHVVLGLYKEYGPIFRIVAPFRRSVVFVTSVEDTEKMFHSEGKYPYRDEFHPYAHYKRSKNLGEGIAASENETWKIYRQLGQKVLGGPQAALEYLPQANTIAEIFTEKLANARSDNDEVKNFCQIAKKWSFETMNMMVLGKMLGIFDSGTDAHELFEATLAFFETTTELEKIPPIWKYYPTSVYKKLCRATDIMLDKCYGYVLEAMKNPIPNSMLAKLYKDVDDEQTHNQVVDVLADLLIASIDTTSTTLTYLLHYLALNPEKQELARKEVLEHTNYGDPIDKHALNSFSFLKACLKETLRIKGVAAGTGRVFPQDVVLSGYLVPAGTKVVALTSLTTLDETYFSEPGKFLPERWLRNSPSYSQSSRWAYLPFGHGPRACIGRRFAEMEVWVAAAHLLRRFRIETTTPDFDLVMKLINMPDRPINMVFHDLDTARKTPAKEKS